MTGRTVLVTGGSGGIGKETARGLAYKAAFERAGLENVHVDAVGNVLGERRGTGGRPTVVLAGHLDTVFPEGTDVHVTLTRVAKSLRGRLVGALIPVAGARMLGKQFQSVLRKAESA